MGPIEALKTYLSGAFKFSGRASRSEYAWKMFYTFVLYFLLLFATIKATDSIQGADIEVTGPFLWGGIAAVYIAFQLPLDIRRVRDIGTPVSWYVAWLIFLVFVEVSDLLGGILHWGVIMVTMSLFTTKSDYWTKMALGERENGTR